MKIQTAFSLFTVFMVLTVIAAGAQQVPVFRSRVDLMQLDVTVLDKKGVPVRGLAKGDFTLLEDDKPQTIEGFTAVDLPDVTSAAKAAPAWAKAAPRDVVTNEFENDRIFVLVLDDAAGMGDRWSWREMQKTAESFIDKLGPTDQAAVVFTGMAYASSQNLTNDHARLLKAVRAYPVNDRNLIMKIPHDVRTQPGVQFCQADKEVLRTIEGIVTRLASLPDRRKAILFFGFDMPWAGHPTANVCGTYWMWQDVFVAAQRAHVTINPIDTAGLLPPRPGREGSQVGHQNEVHLIVADNTGGHAVINTNDFEPGLRQILTENSSYYLLAFQPTNKAEDGTFRRLTVKVSRPDVKVTTRRGYWAPRPRTAEEPSPAVEAMAGILPVSDLPLRATAAAFGSAEAPGAIVALSVGLRQPPFDRRTQDTVEVVASAFSADGEPRGSDTQLIPITVPAARGDGTSSRYEVLARIDLPGPGKYQLRLTAHSEYSDKTGSVYADVDVPDFQNAPLTLSDVVLNNALSPDPVAPPRALRAVVPLAPTTERLFTTADLVTAFARAYQGGDGALTSAKIRTRIRDARDHVVDDRSDTIAAEGFDGTRSADIQWRLPLSGLSAGEYLLSIEASAGKATSRRDVPFGVK